MRRPGLLYLLIPAVLAATASLAYYSLQLQARRNQVIRDTMQELAEEKMIGIQTAIREAEAQMFSAIDYENIQEIPKLMSERPVTSVLVLNDRYQVVPGGHHTKLPDRRGFLELFTRQVLPDLNPARARVNQAIHLHSEYDGLPYLFAAVRRFWSGRTFYVVIEFDLYYLVSTVFPQFFNVQSKSLYQVVDDSGELVYGFPFAGIPQEQAVEVPFPETLTKWRLRVVQKNAPSLAEAESRQATADLVLIGLALVVILSGLAGLVVIVRRERRLNELKSEFISNVSHELKTPLSIISMFGELISLGRVRSIEHAKEYAEIVRRESVRLTRLIDNVLDFARIERGADVYEFSDGESLSEVVETAVEISKPRLERTSLELEVDIEEELPTLRLDRNAMTLAVLNLIDNAIKYGADGKRICVRLHRHEGGLQLEVQDFGPGVEEAECEQIFERFYRARAARAQQVRGSGIGLALVKRIAEAHEGRVSLKSELGKGCTFRLWIPASDG